MCGILGRWQRTGAPIDDFRWARAVNLLRHRGPDDGACWSGPGVFLGHRRLAIIDLSPAGLQPMASGCGRYVITFNGEIYNFVELRQQLDGLGQRFRSRSDTEVILAGYAQWGPGVVEKLDGMFAFGLYDRHARTLFLARDRFGEKPLYYADDVDGVTFASELSPIAATMPSREIDAEALGGYLSLNYVPGDRTLLSTVHRVPAGSWRLYAPDREPRVGRYFDPSLVNADVRLSAPQVLDTLEAHLDDSVRLCLRSDVPVGVFLSGGVDSSVVAASAVRSGRLTGAYCLVVEEKTYSEWSQASVTARQLGLPLTAVRLNDEAFTQFMDVVSHADDPLADSSALAVWTLARAVAATHKVVLSGDGGDEMFGGYLTYKATQWHAAVTMLPGVVRSMLATVARTFPTSEAKVSGTYKAMRFLRAASLSSGMAHLTWNGTWLPAQARTFLAPALRERASSALDRLLSRHGLPPTPSLRELQSFDISEYLANDILVKVDRMSMAHGLEVRSPLLFPKIAEYALSLPDELKVRRFGAGKPILRELAAARYGLSAARAPKQGFSIPVHRWLRGRGRPLVTELLDRDSVAATGILDVEAVSGAVDAHMSRRASIGWELWGLLVLVAWHRARIATAPMLATDPVRMRSTQEMGLSVGAR